MILIVLFVQFDAFSQDSHSERRSLSIEGQDVEQVFTLTPELFDHSPFVTMALFGNKNTAWSLLEIRTFNNNSWSSWSVVSEDTHIDILDGNNSFAQLLYFQVETSKFALRLKEANLTWSGFVDIYYPSETVVSIERDLNLRSKCDLPIHFKRNQWCPDDSCLQGVERIGTDVTHLIVHHSAGPNENTDWDAVVRSIWHFHSVTRGWDDIGYNWLISPKGVLYEGRGEGIRGAHFCGHNSGTTGICMMGTYSDVSPKQIAVSKLEKYLAWASKKWTIIPNKRTYHASSETSLDGVSGHRDACSTTCPGDVLWGKLSDIRNNVSVILNDCGGIDPPGDTTIVERDPNTFKFKGSLSSNEIRIELGKYITRPLYVFLYDMGGRLIWRKRIKNLDTSFDLSNISPGMYIVKIKNDFVEKIYKIVHL